MRMLRSVLTLAAVLVTAVAVTAQVKSVYTPLSDTKCKTLESNPDEGGSYVGECEGVGGYKLHVIEGDLRQTVNVIAPGGKKFELRLWDQFGGFSAVGPRAEWRVKGSTPVEFDNSLQCKRERRRCLQDHVISPGFQDRCERSLRNSSRQPRQTPEHRGPRLGRHCSRPRLQDRSKATADLSQVDVLLHSFATAMSLSR